VTSASPTLASRFGTISLLCLRVGLAVGCSLAATACGDDLEAPEPEPPAPLLPRAVVVSGDFGSTGVLSVVDVTAGTIRTKVVAGAAAADPVIRYLGDELFVVNRFGPTGSNVTVLDATTFEVTQQLSTGTNSNPQDAAVIGEVIYLPALDTKGVVMLLRNGSRTLIDLSALDPDGKPDCNSVYAVDGKLVITCGLLEGFAATRDAVVVVYDPADRSMITVPLAARNPIGFLQPTPKSSVFGGDLLIGTADYLDPSKQCLLRINPQTGASSCAVTNAALGGIANHYESDPSTGTLFVAPTYYDADFQLQGALRAVDLTSAAVAPKAWSAATQAISDLAVCPDGTVVASDASFGASGVRIFAAGVERTTAPLGIGLPPAPQNGIVCY
jgi:hypothetical protein